MKREVFTAEVTSSQAQILHRVLALMEELNDLALSAPDGTVFDTCELAVVEKGRDLSKRLLSEAVARRVEAAEKKGRHSASVSAVGPKKTAAPSPANSSAPSA
jgi:hypothetical protein